LVGSGADPALLALGWNGVGVIAASKPLRFDPKVIREPFPVSGITFGMSMPTPKVFQSRVRKATPAIKTGIPSKARIRRP
jgi:hypothetical protein